MISMQSAITVPVTSTVSHAPSPNFSRTLTTRIPKQSTNPIRWMGRCRGQSGYLRRVSFIHQYRIIPAWLSEKVTKTLIEYITTSASTDPPVCQSMNNEVAPIRSTPFCMVRRELRAPKRCGSQESCAMFAITRGPSMKPACAATNSSRASEVSVMTTKPLPTGIPARLQLPASLSASTAFIVFPGSGCTSMSRYPRMMPAAVSARLTAM